MVVLKPVSTQPSAVGNGNANLPARRDQMDDEIPY